MDRSEKLYNMAFSDLYPLYIKKLERKNLGEAELLSLLNWLFGYNENDIRKFLDEKTSLRDFINLADKKNPLRENISGSICNVKIQGIKDPLMKEIRYMDKLVDDLYKGKNLEKIIEKLTKK